MYYYYYYKTDRNIVIEIMIRHTVDASVKAKASNF